MGRNRGSRKRRGRHGVKVEHELSARGRKTKNRDKRRKGKCGTGRTAGNLAESAESYSGGAFILEWPAMPGEGGPAKRDGGRRITGGI